jgi:peptidoglycan/xylan/chitin deacetylase (PgdA/CDA1 family)
MMKSVKQLVARLVVKPGLNAGPLRKAAVVVAFHRVHDGAPPADSLTVDVTTFERYCRYFQQHFHVVPLSDLVAGLQAGRAPARDLAITFDDGYRDNFENAAPVLERLSLPATFFVVTRWMGSGMVPFWDRQRGVQHPWMTWDHVRSLHRRGFEIGAHTRTHADLGRVSGSIADDEIFGSKRDLEEQLGATAVAFAYPFGGQGNLTESNRQRVRAAGFSCCCSGFGGINAAGGDPFRLQRIPLSSFYSSPYEFGFDLAFGRTNVTWPGAPSSWRERLVAHNDRGRPDSGSA